MYYNLPMSLTSLNRLILPNFPNVSFIESFVVFKLSLLTNTVHSGRPFTNLFG